MNYAVYIKMRVPILLVYYNELEIIHVHYHSIICKTGNWNLELIIENL